MDVDGISVAAALAIKNGSVVSGYVSSGTGHLILVTFDGTEIDAGSVTPTPPDTSFVTAAAAGSAWTARTFSIANHSNGLVTLRGSAKPATAITVLSGGVINLYGDRPLNITIPTLLKPGSDMSVMGAIDDSAHTGDANDIYPVECLLRTNGLLQIMFSPVSGTSIGTNAVFKWNITYAK